MKADTDRTDGMAVSGYIRAVARDRHGNVKWVDEGPNLVTTAGRNLILNASLRNGTTPATIYVGLLGSSPSISATTALSGITEVTAYSGNRPAWVTVDSTTGNLTNAAAVAQYTINANDTTYGGAFLSDVASGTSGTLIAGRARTGGNRTLDEDDTLEVTYQINLTAS